jgi:hypothetical protein
MTNSTLLPTPPAVAVAPPLDQAGEAPEPPAPVHLPRRVRVEQAILSNPWVERIGREAFAASMGISRGPHKVTIERNIAVPMPDGVILIADRYAPQDGGPRPAIIMRTPYNRTGGTVIGGIFPWYFASYGYNVLIQDVRGRFASGGEYAPFLYEAEDGAATVAWTLQQPWCDGAVGMWGASYLGYCQWSAAATAPAGSVKALAPLMTSAWLMRYPENGFPLDLLARWMLQLATMTDPTLPLGERLRRINDAAVQDQLLAAAFNHLPLATADEAAIGHPSPHYRRMAEAERDHPNWRVTNFTDRVAHCPPGDFVSGWYDLFLDGLLDDFCALSLALTARLEPGQGEPQPDGSLRVRVALSSTPGRSIRLHQRRASSLCTQPGHGRAARHRRAHAPEDPLGHCEHFRRVHLLRLGRRDDECRRAWWRVPRSCSRRRHPTGRW